MRLWHYELVRNSLLPKSQLVAQWRELNSIFKKQDKHILINYIYEYHKSELLEYTCYVIQSMQRNGIRINSYENLQNYFGLTDEEIIGFMYLDQILIKFTPFKKHHNDKYLLICFMNLLEKKTNNQKDFSDKCFNGMYDFVNKIFNLKEIGVEKYA